MTAPLAPLDAETLAAAAEAKAWPFEEARKIVKRLERSGRNEVLFETGYGPSGLPHIGTFGEVARTTMVRHAFRILTRDAVPTRLLSFSDDMDGLRKVPDNVPNKALLAANLEKPLTVVPDPFGTHDSFGRHNNARLRAFLDRFGFDYEFASATDYYTAGRFDEALVRILEVYDAVMAIMLPTLGEERQATYSPILPISKVSGKVLQVPLLAIDAKAGTVTYHDPDLGEDVTTTVTGGAVKCQWKADWAMRWFALGVDYEMSGKDLIDSVTLASKICKVMGGTPPDGFNYELFLDKDGKKISKSKGNGLTIDEWLAYASAESLSLFMFQKPKAAKRLHFDVIPRAVDEYYQFLGAVERQPASQRLANPVWHIHSGRPEPKDLPVSFSMLLNLASASNAREASVLWGYLTRYRPDLKPGERADFDALVESAVRYFVEQVLPQKRFRAPSTEERAALADLAAAIAALPEKSDAGAIQDVVYDIGRKAFPDPAKTGPDGGPGVSLTWFAALYEILLGEEKGPRFGSFVELYGQTETVALIEDALEGRLVAKNPD